MKRPASLPAPKRTLAVCVGLAALAVAVFLPGLGHEFVNFDDGNSVRLNPSVRGGLTWRSIAWAFQTAHASNWHPVAWLSHMLDVQLFGLWPGGHWPSWQIAGAAVVLIGWTR